MNKKNQMQINSKNQPINIQIYTDPLIKFDTDWTDGWYQWIVVANVLSYDKQKFPITTTTTTKLPK